MKLTTVEIEGFRSIREKTVLNVEPNVTVVLGPNDHGKSNLLAALSFLNEEMKFHPEDDLNWDLAGKGEMYPFLKFVFNLTVDERNQIREIENGVRLARITPQPPAEPPASPDPVTLVAPATSTPVVTLELDGIPDKVTFSRKGITSSVTLESWEGFSDEAMSHLRNRIPRVEIIKPYDKIEDSVTAATLKPENNEFMRGIFYYAGLDPDNCDALFTQDDRTLRQLKVASDQLESTLKRSWSQGAALRFSLNHNSKIDAIELRIEDPAVSQRMVRASQRSAGFTNYFAIKTILHARQKAHRASSYIYLFDEPGLYLHPSGQFDLLQVLETLGKFDQVLYVTHSLFLINKSHPTRHRLIRKTGKGTTIEGKPYLGRWGVVLSALGLSLSGTILFANEVLLTEGDSDPIYIQACFQKMIAEGKVAVEINGFSAMGTGDGKNADVMLRTLAESEPHPKVMMLFDGDEGGKERELEIRSLLEALKGSSMILEKDEAIEDNLPGGDKVYVSAVCRYLSKLLELKGQPKDENLEATATEDFQKWRKGGGIGIAKWCEQFSKSNPAIKKTPSKVGIAREYVLLLQEIPLGQLDETGSTRCLKLLNQIASQLQLPPQVASPAEILIADK